MRCDGVIRGEQLASESVGRRTVGMVSVRRSFGGLIELWDTYLVCMRSSDEYNRASPWDTESTTGVYLAEEEVHKNCMNPAISDLIPL